MKVFILINADGTPYKGDGWRRGGRIKAFDNSRSANIAAGLAGRGVTVREIEVPA